MPLIYSDHGKRCLNGCCGIMEIYRLRGTEPNSRIAKRTLRKRGQDAPPITVWDPTKLSALFSAMTNSLDDYDWGQRYELTDAFLGVLCGLSPFTTFVASDNMQRTGDVNTGIFSTKNWVQWFIDEELGEVTTPADPMKSHRGGNHKLRAWIMYPNWTKIKPLFEPAVHRISTVIGDINSGRKDKSSDSSEKSSNTVQSTTRTFQCDCSICREFRAATS